MQKVIRLRLVFSKGSEIGICVAASVTRCGNFCIFFKNWPFLRVQLVFEKMLKLRGKFFLLPFA